MVYNEVIFFKLTVLKYIIRYLFILYDSRKVIYIKFRQHNKILYLITTI